LGRPEVRKALREADLIIPSLDAADETRFRQINRPHESIRFREMVDGLIALRQEFTGLYWLEVLLLAGLTDSEAEVAGIARWAERIGPDRVQLNTATRPAAEVSAEPVSRERLTGLATLFTPPAEVIADFTYVHERAEFRAGREEVLDMLRRRPCSVQEIAEGLGMHVNEASKYVEELIARGLLRQRRIGGACWYTAVPRD
jgi:wyosine [tRNA(Phe)-imidazoG37] synthetase (radical SAM superfamily)